LSGTVISARWFAEFTLPFDMLRSRGAEGLTMTMPAMDRGETPRNFPSPAAAGERAGG
jgi:hypothetical protein